MKKKHDISMTLVGCGAMGSALLEGWMKTQGLFSKVTIVKPHPSTVQPFLDRYDTLTCVDSIHKVLTIGEVLILAVKPQPMAQVLQDYADLTTPQTLIISIAAGLDLSFYEKALGDQKQIVRLMPNTPATISKAMSGLLANAYVTPAHKELATTIADAVGSSLWVESDDQLDRLTAISGCGPAYLFSMVEALEQAAQTLGFEAQEATHLARETIIGSAQYLAQTPQKSATDLRIQVTSPGGMTAAGLEKLQRNDRLTTLMQEVTQAAFHKATDLKA